MLSQEKSVVIAERRRHHRVKMFLGIICTSKIHKEPFQMMTENMSVSGMKFVSHIDMGIDEVVTMDVALPSPFPALRVKGHVVWCQRRQASEKPVFEGGVEFTKIGDGDRKMLEWFLERY
jgi:hypothetical protein